MGNGNYPWRVRLSLGPAILYFTAMMHTTIVSACMDGVDADQTGPGWAHAVEAMRDAVQDGGLG